VINEQLREAAGRDPAPFARASKRWAMAARQGSRSAGTACWSAASSSRHRCSRVGLAPARMPTSMFASTSSANARCDEPETGPGLSAWALRLQRAVAEQSARKTEVQGVADLHCTMARGLIQVFCARARVDEAGNVHCCAGMRSSCHEFWRKMQYGTFMASSRCRSAASNSCRMLAELR